MALTVTLPEGFQYTGAAIISTFWLTFWQTFRVGRARSKAKIAYPQLYAEKAEAAANKEALKFNCAQRAHQNTLEMLPMVLVSTVVAGTKWPIFAAAACGTWVVARVVYTIGYSTGNPDKRNSKGINPIGSLSAISLLIGSTYLAVKGITDSL